MEIADNYAPFRLGREKKHQPNKTNVNHGPPWPGLGRHHPNIGTSWWCSCHAVQRTARWCPRAQARIPDDLVPVRSRDVASTRPPALGCCHPSHRTAAVQRHRIRDPMVRIVQRPLSARNNVLNETASKNQGAKTPRPEQTQYTLTSPLKHHKKGGTIPFHTRSTNPHPETPMHNSPPQPPSSNLNPSARHTSEEYRPLIHKTTIYLPTQTPPVSLPCTTSTVRRKKSGNIPPPPHFFLP